MGRLLKELREGAKLPYWLSFFAACFIGVTVLLGRTAEAMGKFA